MFRLDLSYVYPKLRRDFGRPPAFTGLGPSLLFDFVPDADQRDKYIPLNPSWASTQYGPSFSAQEILTEKVGYKRRNVNFAEGGWPGEVNTTDEDIVMRFRRKMERDENVVQRMPQMLRLTEHILRQNNALDIYSEYFSDWDIPEDSGEISVRLLRKFRDLDEDRPVTNISWAPNGKTTLLSTYGHLTFQTPIYRRNNYAFIWNMENPSRPVQALLSEFPCYVMEFNHRDERIVAGGQFNGQVVFFDTRAGLRPVQLSSEDYTFRDPVNNLIWTASKSAMEFFCSSTDGQIMWFDVRHLSEPLESLILDFTKGEQQKIHRGVGISCLEFEPTIPTRFMVGTENGQILGANKKGKTLQEKFNSSPWQAHLGPVKFCGRNPLFLKNFLTIGDWRTKIWSEDCKESCILWTGFHEKRVQSAAWSPTKLSSFFTATEDGVFQAWDLVESQDDPVLTYKIGNDPIRAMKVHETGGMIAVGTDSGNVEVLEFSEHFTSHDPQEKNVLMALFDRESKREKLLEAKGREMRLRARGAVEEEEDPIHYKERILEGGLDLASKDYFAGMEILRSGGAIKATREYAD